MAVIVGADLASYPGISGTEDSLEGLAAMASTSSLDAWSEPIDPAPLWVKHIALGAAARARWNPKGLEMLSRQVDDAKRTEQFSKEDAGQVGVYLTRDERVLLGGTSSSTAGVGTIRVQPRGWAGA